MLPTRRRIDKSAALKAVQEQAIRLGGLIDSFLDDRKEKGEGHGWATRTWRASLATTRSSPGVRAAALLRGRRTGPR